MKTKHQTIKIILCDECGCDLHIRDGFPYYKDDENELYFCIKCSHKRGFMSNETYWHLHGVNI